ncbi:unnamed protein product, partial [Chrysoparadoxa australica]
GREQRKSKHTREREGQGGAASEPKRVRGTVPSGSPGVETRKRAGADAQEAPPAHSKAPSKGGKRTKAGAGTQKTSPARSKAPFKGGTGAR